MTRAQAALVQAAEEVISFLEWVEWNDSTSEVEAEDLRVLLSECVGAAVDEDMREEGEDES